MSQQTKTRIDTDGTQMYTWAEMPEQVSCLFKRKS